MFAQNINNYLSEIKYDHPLQIEEGDLKQLIP